MGQSKAQCPARIGFGPFDCFLLFINDFGKVIESKATSVLFADDAGVLITSQNTNYEMIVTRFLTNKF